MFIDILELAFTIFFYFCFLFVSFFPVLSFFCLLLSFFFSYSVFFSPLLILQDSISSEISNNRVSVGNHRNPWLEVGLGWDVTFLNGVRFASDGGEETSEKGLLSSF